MGVTKMGRFSRSTGWLGTNPELSFGINRNIYVHPQRICHPCRVSKLGNFMAMGNDETCSMFNPRNGRMIRTPNTYGQNGCAARESAFWRRGVSVLWDSPCRPFAHMDGENFSRHFWLNFTHVYSFLLTFTCLLIFTHHHQQQHHHHQRNPKEPLKKP